MEVELVDDDVVFKKGWGAFESQNNLYAYNWAVFTYTKIDEIIVNIYNVPMKETNITIGGRIFPLVDLSATTGSDTDTESSVNGDTVDETDIDDEIETGDEYETDDKIDTDDESESDDEMGTDDDSVEMNIYEDDEPDDPNHAGPPSFKV